MRRVPIGTVDLPTVAAFTLATLLVALTLAGPRILDHDAGDALADALTTAPVEATGLRLETVVDMGSLRPSDPFTSHGPIHTRFGPAPDLEPFETPSMFDVDDPGLATLDIPRFLVSELNGRRPAFTMKVSVRLLDDFDQLANVVAVAGPLPPELIDDTRPPTVDVMVTEATAASLGVELGDLLEVQNDGDAPITRAYQSLPAIVTMRIAGVVELVPDDDPVWFGDGRLHRATRNDTPDGFEVLAFVTMPPDAFANSPWATHDGGLAVLTQTHRLGVDDPTLDDAERWADELQRMDASGVGVPAVGQPIGRSRLAALLADVATARVASERIVSVVLFALAALVVLTVLRLGHHAVANRRRALAVLRSRGTSTMQIMFTTIVIGVVFGAAAGVAGSALSVVAAPTAPTPIDILFGVVAAAVGSGVLAAIVVTGAAWGDLALELAAADRPPAPAQRTSDLIVLAVAVVGVTTVVQRAGPTSGFDHIGAAAVVTVAVGGGIVGRRVLRSVAGRSHPERLEGDLALRRISSGRSTAPLIIEAVALATALIGVTASVGAWQRAERIDHSWMQAPAPIRVEAELGTELDEAALASIPGVDGVAGETTLTGPLAVGDQAPAIVTLLALDSADLQRMIADDPRRPLGDVDLATTSDGGRIPVLVPIAGVGNGPIAVGTEVQGVGALDAATMRVVGTHDARQITGPALVVDRLLLERALERSMGARAVSIDGTPDIEVLESVPNVARVIVREDVLARLEADPLDRGVAFGLRFVLVLSGALVLLVVAFAAALLSTQRRTQSALLAALGAGRSTVERAVTLELLAALGCGLLSGAAAGAVSLRLLGPVFGREPASDPGSGIPVSTLPLAVAVGAVVVLGAVTATMMTRRANSDDTARTLRNELT